MKTFSKIIAIVSIFATMALLSACTPSSSADMKKRYEENGYNVTVIIAESDNNETISWKLTATPKSESVAGAIGNIGKVVTATCYKDKAKAQEAYDALSDVDADKKLISGAVVVVGFDAESVKIAK